MLRLVVHTNSRSMRAYVTPQNRIIPHCASAIYAKYSVVSRAWFSNSRTQKQAQVVAPIPTEDLKFESASVGNIISDLNISHAQLNQRVQGKSLAVIPDLTLLRTTR
jgi:hypothetical protein